MSQLAIESVVDRINALYEQERDSLYLISDYLNEVPESQQMIDELCRTKICEWYFQFVDCTKLQRKTAVSAASLLDKYLSSGNKSTREVIRSRKKYQLAAMTTLFISIKLFESYSIDTALLASLSKQFYKKEEFSKMENHIVLSLNWKLNFPTALCFLEYFIKFVPIQHTSNGSSNSTTTIIKTYSKYLVERSVENYKLSMEKPSYVALAAISISMEKFSDFLRIDDGKADFLKLMHSIEKYTHLWFDESHIQDVIDRILHLPSKQSKSIFNALSSEESSSESRKIPAQESKLDRKVEEAGVTDVSLTNMSKENNSQDCSINISSNGGNKCKNKKARFLSRLKSHEDKALLEEWVPKHPLSNKLLSTGQIDMDNKNKSASSVINDFGKIFQEDNNDTNSSLSPFEPSSWNRLHEKDGTSEKKNEENIADGYSTPPTMSPLLQKENEALTNTKKALPRLSLQQIQFPILDNRK